VAGAAVVDVPDLRGTHFHREQIAMAQRLYAVCRLPYGGPDPLGLGLGWCCVGAGVLHKSHKDQYGRVWETAEYAVRDASVTINGRCPACGSSKRHNAHHRDRKGRPVPMNRL
jgi:hypothetical protein